MTAAGDWREPCVGGGGRRNRKLMTNVWNIPCQRLRAERGANTRHEDNRHWDDLISRAEPSLGRPSRNLISPEQQRAVRAVSWYPSHIPSTTALNMFNMLASVINGYQSTVIEHYKSSLFWKEKSNSNSNKSVNHCIFSKILLYNNNHQ